MSERTLPVPLPLHLGAVGLAGGWMIADGYQLGALAMDESARLIVTVVTPVVGAVLGLLLGRVALRGRAHEALAWTLGATLAAGLVIGEIAWSRFGLLRAAGYGELSALAFLPTVGAVVATARRVGRARPGSIVDRADRRAVLVATATSISFGSLAALVPWNRFSKIVPVDGSLAMCVLAIVALFVAFATDFAEAVGMARLADTVLVMTPSTSSTECSGVVFDVGVGEAILEDPPAGASGYRMPDRPARRVIGDPDEGESILRAASVRSFACLVVATGVVAFAIINPANLP